MENLFTNYELKRSKANSERAALIEDFLVRLNAERVGTKYKPLTPRTVAIKVGHLNTAELYAFMSQCKESRSGFSRCFFGALKVKRDSP